MLGTSAVNEDAEIGIFAKQRPTCAGVVEMNMGEQNGLEIGDGKSARLQQGAQAFQSGCRARIENCMVAAGFKENSGDRVRAPHPVEIKYGCRIHMLGMVREHRDGNKSLTVTFARLRPYSGAEL